MRSTGNEMEKVLNGDNHSEYCQFNNGSIVCTKVKEGIEDEFKAEELVCKKSEMKKRDHWKHIELKNMIGNINALVLRSGTTVDKPKPKFSRRVKGTRSRSNKIYQAKVKGKRSRSNVRTNTKNKLRRIKV